ncbi:unnamed protein product [Ilex paraguariensis]|uniref:Uncharacterized protein n=1 Tax=Ilex paraguariensis TaxID=185542 RepID=A0ABC8U3P6_9AQUA
MGSLMAGWDSHVPDPKAVKLKRNQSLTKEGIETYWRKKKQIEEEHLKAISDLSSTSQVSALKETEKRLQRSSSLPEANTKFLDTESESSLEKLILKNGWWISSNSAFLNEPPVIESEGPTYKYAAQFHVASMAASKPHGQTGISA